MKKEMKFSELPEKVQGFLRRQYDDTDADGLVYDPEDTINLNWLHNKADWSKATNEERLDYAEFVYLKGTEIISTQESYGFVDDGKFCFYHGNIYCNNEERELYNKVTGKWAQIISTPEEIDHLGELGKIGSEAGEKFRKSLTNNKPIFKVGDRPEWTVDLIKQLPHGAELECAVCGEAFKYNGQETRDFINQIYIEPSSTGAARFFTSNQNTNAKILSLPDIYLNPVKPEEEFEAGEMVYVKGSGNIIFKVLHIDDGIAWVISMTNEPFHLLPDVTDLRKIDTDARLKALAEEVLKQFNIPNDEEIRIFRGKRIESMLIEMGKKVQDKIK